MTRKKSNVKALALAVTCAILTGGGIGLEPVYAADVLTYDTSEHQLKNGATAIDTLTVGGVTIGGGGAITADSLALTGTDGTTNVGAAIKDNANNIQAVNGQVTNIKTDVTSLKTTTGQLQTKVGELTDSDTAARNYIISLQKKTEGISEDGSEITTNSLKLRESGSSEEQEITAAKVKGYDKAVAAVGDTSTEGTLAYNTQKIKFKKDNMITTDDATYIEGITHAGDVRLAKGEVRAKRIVLEEVFDNDTSAEATLTRESIVNLHGMINGTTKIQVADGSEVGGVTFGQGKVTNVVSINDNLKFESDGIYLNKGDQTKQIKIDNDGKIIIGTSSSAYDTDGFYAGGDDYGAAKAGIKSDGSLKATGFTVDGATGNTTVGGNLTVNGAANFAQETTFANGIKTDKINEKNDGKGVTVDGVLLKDGGITATGNVTTTGDIQGNNITATGVLKGQTLGIGGAGNAQFTVEANGNTNVGGTLDVTGATTLKDTLNVKGATTLGSTLDVTGKTTLKDELQVDKKATFGNATGLHTVIEGGNITAGGMLNSGSAKIGSVGIDNTGAITGVTSLTTDALTVTGAFTTGGNLTVNGDLTASGAINGKTISINDGGSIAGVNFETGGKLTATTGTIGDVSFAAGGNVSGISELTATTIKDGAGTIITGGKVESKTAKIGAINIDNETIEGSYANGLSIEGVKIKDGVMSSVVSIEANKATIGGVNTLDNKGLTVKAGSKVQVGTNTVIEDGSVQVSQKTSLTDQSLQLNDTNKWTNEGGLVADKATVNGIALGTDSQGKATFSDAAGNTTTIDGNKITTGTITADELNVDKISLGKGTDKNITIGSNGDVTTKGDVTVTGDDNDTTVIDGAKATFGNDVANQTVIDKGKISANAKDINNQQAGLTFDENGLTVNGQNAEGKTSAFGFNTKKGIGTFKGLDETTTTVNGSVITSIKSATDTGVLNGSNLTLVNGDNKTELTAGGVSFTGKKGASAQEGNKTTIDGGIITTDTLKVQRIQLGEKIVDERTGKEIGSGVTLAADGGFTAAGGNFKVTGGTTGSRGSITNVVGDDASGKTSFTTNQKGAKMSFKKGDVTSNVSVADGSANVSAGAGSIDVTNESITSKVTDNATSTITKDSIVDKVGNNSVTTDANGTTFANGGSKTTNINGGTITTGKLITDELVITGKGDAAGDGSGSLAFGGNGTIKSDVKEAGSAKNTQFTTDIDGVNTKVTDGTTTTENKVTAAGNSSTVTKDDKHKSEFNQGLTSIGGVVTNGEIKVAQKLDGETGLLTNEVTDANGSSKLEQSGTGLTYTDSAKPDNATRINSSDVSIGSATDDSKRINLSDLGQIDELDKELTDRDEYKNNSTAVGGINAEAAIRREEVARLDGRINDVNDRINKVGAMAAAIASLKSIGYDPQAPSEFSIGLGQYKGETGVAMGFFHYPNKNFMINVSLSTAGGETMGGIGATWRFGHKSPQKLLEEQREEQAKKELAAAEKYQAAAKLAKEAQERAEYAAKLARQAQVSADNAKAAADATQAKHFG